MMSVPQELLDQLLSGYLDDALSADELARIEQLLQTEPDVASELSELRAMRGSLQAVAQADAGITLDKGFSDRVIGAAVARAQAEGLGEDHPLVRLAEQPSTTRSDRSWTGGRSAPLRAVGLLVAIAASIMVAFVVLRPQPDDDLLVAEAQPDPAIVDNEPTTLPDTAVEAPEAVEPEMIASSQPAEVASPDVSPSERLSPENVRGPESSPAQPSVAEIASAANANIPNSNDRTKPPAAIRVTPVSIMVVDLTLTKQGRQTDAIGRAMMSAGLAPTSRKEVNDELAAVAKESVDASSDEDQVAVLYLQSSARKLDDFFLRVYKDTDGIASIRSALTMNAPILNAVKSVAVEPELVQHNESTLQLFSEDDSIYVFADQLGQLPMRELDRSEIRKQPKEHDGPIVPSHMLVLIR